MAGLADAATDRVSINQAPALGTWSACAWVKLATNASFSPIVRVEAGGGTAMVFGFKNLTPSLYSASSPAGVVGPAITLNQYTFVAATRNGTAVALYQGTDPGSLTKTTGTVNSAGTPDTWTVFGRSPSDGSEWFSGTVDYLRTWGGTVLSDAEAAAEGAASAPVKAGTWGVWPFGNNGSGGVSLNDTSGNARHLTAGSTLLTLAADVSLTPTIVGTGTAAAANATAAGTGGAVVTGSGAVTATPGAVAGSGGAVASGSGSAVASPPTAAGVAVSTVAGSGAAVALPPSSSGAGGTVAAGSGSGSASPATAAGAAGVEVAGSGVAVAPAAVSAGLGGSLETIGGDGAAVASPATAAGSGGVIVSGSATAVAAPAHSAGSPAAPGSLRLQIGESRELRWLDAGTSGAVTVVGAGASSPAFWLVSGDGGPT